MLQIKDQLKPVFFTSGQRKPAAFIWDTDKSRQSWVCWYFKRWREDWQHL